MTRITLTLELNPKDLSALCEVLPRLAAENDTAATDQAERKTETAVNSGDTPKAADEKKLATAKPKTGKTKAIPPSQRLLSYALTSVSAMEFLG